MRDRRAQRGEKLLEAPTPLLERAFQGRKLGVLLGRARRRSERSRSSEAARFSDTPRAVFILSSAEAAASDMARRVSSSERSLAALDRFSSLELSGLELRLARVDAGLALGQSDRRRAPPPASDSGTPRSSRNSARARGPRSRAASAGRARRPARRRARAGVVGELGGGLDVRDPLLEARMRSSAQRRARRAVSRFWMESTSRRAGSRAGSVSLCGHELRITAAC